MIFILSYVTIAASCYAETLQDAVNQTLKTHPDILSVESQQGATAYTIRQAQGGWLPNFNAEGGWGHENSDNPFTRVLPGNGDLNMAHQESNFVIQQLLFDGGNVSNQIYQAKSNYQGKTFQVLSSKESLGYQAAQSYLNVLRNRELVTIADYSVKAHQELYEKVAKRLAAGAGRKSELQLADSRLALAESQYDVAVGLLYSANDNYTKLIGTPPAEDLSLPKIPNHIPTSLAEAQREAIRLNPAIKATDAQIAVAQAQAGIAKSAYYPKVTVDLNQSFNENLSGVRGYDNDRQELVRMTYNIFNGGSDKAAIEAANYNLYAAEHNSASIRRTTLAQVGVDWSTLQANLNSLPSLQTHVTQAYNVWQAYEKQFQLGQRTLFDLVDAQDEYINARTALTNTQYDVRIGRYQLLSDIGIFVETVEKNEGIPDPYAKIWAPTKKFMVITQSSEVRQPPPPSPAAVIDNFAYTPKKAEMPRGDVQGKAEIEEREKILSSAEKEYQGLTNGAPTLSNNEWQPTANVSTSPQNLEYPTTQTMPSSTTYTSAAAVVEPALSSNVAALTTAQQGSLFANTAAPKPTPQPISPKSGAIKSSLQAIAPNYVIAPNTATRQPTATTSTATTSTAVTSTVAMPTAAMPTAATPTAAMPTTATPTAPARTTASSMLASSQAASPSSQAAATTTTAPQTGLFDSTTSAQSASPASPTNASSNGSTDPKRSPQASESTTDPEQSSKTSESTSTLSRLKGIFSLHPSSQQSTFFGIPLHATQQASSQAALQPSNTQDNFIAEKGKADTPLSAVNTIAPQVKDLSEAALKDSSSKTSIKSSGLYTIQVFATHDKANIEKLEKQLSIKNQIHIFHIATGATPWYIFTVGTYENRLAAKKAIRTLPASLQKLKPMVRDVQHFDTLAVSAP